MTDNIQPHNHPSDEPENPTGQPVDIVRAEALLAQGEIDEMHGIMRWGSNYAALVTISDDELQATAVYKPQRGERPLWDFPDGTLCYREVVAYLVSQALDWQLVPPTVLRRGPHGLGSLQLFIDHDPEINYFSLDDRFVPQLKRYAAFDYVINNADRKGGHLLLDARGKLWGIDHGLAFNAAPKLRTVIWEFAGQCVDEEVLADIQKLYEQLQDSASDLRRKIGTMLCVAEMQALSQRTQHLLDCKEYPRPGSGLNHPWPPI